jgi:hypothetical protein
MNRWTFIPAACSLFAFVALWTTLQGAIREERLSRTSSMAPRIERETISIAPAVPAPARSNDPLTPRSTEQRLNHLATEYLRPWRQWENSPHRLYSRVSPTPIPEIKAEIILVDSAADQNDSSLLATIKVTTGGHSQLMPCVVDRTSQNVSVFTDGRWHSEEDWLKMAPVPRGG